MALTDREIYEHYLVSGYIPTGEELSADVAVGLPRDSASLVKTPTVIALDTITTYDRFGHQITGTPLAVAGVAESQDSIFGPTAIADTGKKLVTYLVVGVIVLVIARALFK